MRIYFSLLGIILTLPFVLAHEVGENHSIFENVSLPSVLLIVGILLLVIFFYLIQKRKRKA